MAGATTLIVSLGIIHAPEQLAVLINRLAGIDYPVWSPRTPAPS